MHHLPKPEADQLQAIITPNRRTIMQMGGVGAMFGGYAVAAHDAEAAPIITPETGLHCGLVHITSHAVADAPFEMPLYVARPNRRGRFPVVVVISEIFGLHAYIADVCRRLARQGIVAVAPAFFNRIKDPAPLSDFQEIIAIVGATPHAQVMGDIGATLDYLGRQGWADMTHVGITGFCWGGAATWNAMAEFSAFKAGVAWYGRLSRPANNTEARNFPIENVGRLHGPVLGLYASNDGGIPQADVDAMNAALKAQDPHGSEILVLPNTQHGFHADYRASYNPAAAQEGWARLLSHFARAGIGSG